MRLASLLALGLGASHCVGGDYSPDGSNNRGGAPSESGGEAGRFVGGSGGSSGAAGGSFEAGAGGIFEEAGSGGTQGPMAPGMSGAGDGSLAVAGGGADGGANPGAGGTLGGGASALGGSIAVLGGAGGEGLDPLSCETRIVRRCLGVWELETVSDPGASDANLSALFPHPSVVEFTNSELNAINASGTIVGARTCANAMKRATRFKNGEAQDLISDVEADYSEALDINDHGVVVGHLARRLSEVTVDPFTHSPAYYGFIWQDGVTRVLDELGPVKVIAINDQGQVLLQRTSMDEAHAIGCQQRCGIARGLLWQDGQVIDIGTLGGASTQPYDLDDAGRVLALSQRGGSQLATDRFVPALWENGVLRQLPFHADDMLDSGDGPKFAVGLGLWNGSEVVQRGPEVLVTSAMLGADGSTVGTYEYNLYNNSELYLSRPFVFTAGYFVPLWGARGGRTFTSGRVNDANEQGIIIGEGRTNELRSSGPPGPLGSIYAEAVSTQSVVWSPDCYLGCCSPVGGPEGGAGGWSSVEGGASDGGQGGAQP